MTHRYDCQIIHSNHNIRTAVPVCTVAFSFLDLMQAPLPYATVYVATVYVQCTFNAFIKES